MHGKVVSMKPAALQRKKAHKDVKALDSEQNQIQVRSEKNFSILIINVLMFFNCSVF